MKAAAFAYHRPGAVDEAVDLLAEYGEDAKILAGGQSLVPMLAMRLTHFDNLIDISRIGELVGIDLCDNEVRIGAATPHAFVELDDDSRVSRCGIGLLGLGSTPLRGVAAEESVVGRPVGEITAGEVGRLAISGLDDIPADLQGSAAYRARVGATMVTRAWQSATAEASNA
jgi:CO/xanthine dehydrogenase FAD-binding subunit